MKVVVAGGLALALCGCVTTTPHVLGDSSRFASEGTAFDGQATVYVMRDLSGAGMAWPVSIKLDSVEKGSVRRETYVRFAAAPGRHDILADWNSLSGLPDIAINGEFVAGKTYYFVLGTSFNTTGKMMQFGTGFGPIDPRLGANLAGKYEDWTPGKSE